MSLRPTKMKEKRLWNHPDAERSEAEGPAFFVYP